MSTLEFWIILAVICLLGEMITNGFALMSIGIGSIAAAIASYLNITTDPIMQVAIFAIVTIICLIASRPFANKITKNSPSKKAATDRLIGKEGIVTEAIDHNTAGMIKISGEYWKAVANERIEANEKVVVENIKGVKLHVKIKK